MPRLFTMFLLLSFLTAGVAAQTAAESAQLTQLLNDFLAGASRNDAAMHDRFWAEDLIYTGSTGSRKGKAEILRDVRSAPTAKPGDPKSVFSAEEIRIQQYGETAIVAFRLVMTTEKEGKSEVIKYYNTGTFLKRSGTWQVVAWQATRIPSPEESPKK
jgi:ketosteroid isomerase-like protein